MRNKGLLVLEVIFSIIIYLTILLYVWGRVEEKVEKATFVPYQREVIPRIEHIEERTTDTFCKLNVEYISQYPELPTGCEITSLAMVLNYCGYDVDKIELVERYMVYRSSDSTGFDGSPYSINGSAMWPPALAATATNFLKDHYDERTGIDVSGAEFAELLQYIGDGVPVIVWVNEGFAPFINYDGTILWHDEKEYRSYWGEHCVVLIGFDLNKEIVYIENPQIGEESINIKIFDEVYRICGKYAIIINMEGE